MEETYQLAIIGGGPAGYTAAEAAGKAGLSVVLFEKQSLGGVCLNEGCIPTKTLLYSAKVCDGARQASKYAVEGVGRPTVDLPKLMARKQKVVRKLVLGIKGKLAAAGVTVVSGRATVVDPHRVECGGVVYGCRTLLLCTGSEAWLPPVPGIDTVPCWTHREVLECRQLPPSLAILGGGVIGMELASYCHSAGTAVTIVEMADEILGGMDRELAAMLRAEYAKRGVKCRVGTKVTGLVPTADGGVCLTGESAAGEALTVEAAQLLVCTGRRPVVEGFGLENLALQRDDKGRIVVDRHMQTSLPGVYVCGDLTGRSMLAHTAVREAEVAVGHIAGRSDDGMSYRAIPAVVYTNPEVAGVGETEESLRQKGVQCDVVKRPMAYSGRFVAENEGVNGLCKLLLDKADGRILGAHVLGNPASEIITLAGMAIELGLTAAQWKKMVFPHPTVGEIFREAL